MVFNDPTVLNAVHAQLNYLQIEVHENYIMESWENEEEPEIDQPIEHVLFRKKTQNSHQDLRLKCTVI